MEMLSRSAAELAVGFRLGLATQAEIVAWADEVIASVDDPPRAVIDLALMSKGIPQDVLGKLSELSLDITSVEALPLALKRFAERLRKTPALGPVVARGLYDIFVESKCNVPDELLPIAGFDDDYWLARSRTHGTESGAYDRLLAFFERFERAA